MNGPQNEFVITNQGPGRHINYFTVYASALNTNNNVKFLAGYKGSFQSHRTVHTFTLKAEYRV